jgi:hypothetical protein
LFCKLSSIMLVVLEKISQISTNIKSPEIFMGVGWVGKSPQNDP